MSDAGALDPALLERAAAVLARLRRSRLTVCTAESCTGGLVAAALTHHPGSSEAVLAGFVTYADSAKRGLLGVEATLLDAHGAVSEAVVAAMAAGALERGGSDLAVSISGIAGPGGGSAAKPVGLVWFGLAARNGPSLTRRVVFPGDRAAVRAAATRSALDLIDLGAGWLEPGAPG